MDRLFTSNIEDRETLYNGVKNLQSVKDVPPKDDFEIASADKKEDA